MTRSIQKKTSKTSMVLIGIDFIFCYNIKEQFLIITIKQSGYL